MLSDIIKSCFEKAQGQQNAEGYIKLERGFATIPLHVIDAPFHSDTSGLAFTVPSLYADVLPR